VVPAEKGSIILNVHTAAFTGPARLNEMPNPFMLVSEGE
jgi:hypothetical protein